MKYLLIIFLLAACATQSQTPVTGSVPLSQELTMTMPAFSELNRNIEVSQLVTAGYKDKSFTFEGHISASKDRFLMVGLDGFGRRAISINWTKDGIKYEAADFVPSRLKPENILADIVILYWPENSVRRAIGANGKLVTAPNKRSVYVGDKKIIHAEYAPNRKDIWDGQVHYKNLQWGYSLDIQSAIAK